MDVPTDSRQDASQGKKVEAPQGKDKNHDKGKDQASDTAVSQSKQAADPEAPKAKAQDTSLINTSIFFVSCFCMFFFLKDMYFTLIINEVMANYSVVISFLHHFFYLNCTYDLEGYFNLNTTNPNGNFKQQQ